jgi:hypothetical protein
MQKIDCERPTFYCGSCGTIMTKTGDFEDWKSPSVVARARTVYKTSAHTSEVRNLGEAVGMYPPPTATAEKKDESGLCPICSGWAGRFQDQIDNGHHRECPNYPRQSPIAGYDEKAMAEFAASVDADADRYDRERQARISARTTEDAQLVEAERVLRDYRDRNADE